MISWPSCSQWSIKTKMLVDLPDPAPSLLLRSVYHCLQKNRCFYLTHEMLANLLSILPLPIVLPLLQEFLSFPWNSSSQSSLSWLNLDLIFTWQLSALDQMTFLKPKSDCVHFTAPLLQIFSLMNTFALYNLSIILKRLSSTPGLHSSGVRSLVL